MKTPIVWIIALTVLAIGCFVGCTTTSTDSAAVTASIRTSLDQSGLQSVAVRQDRDMGVVTLSGDVESEDHKARAESIARSLAGNQVVANEIAVVPHGIEADARQVNSDLDDGIASNLNAALVVAGLNDQVKYTVKNFVVTLSGEVDSPAKRALAANVASGVPNVRQVVNELQVKGQKATSSN